MGIVPFAFLPAPNVSIVHHPKPLFKRPED